MAAFRKRKWEQRRELPKTLYVAWEHDRKVNMILADKDLHYVTSSKYPTKVGRYILEETFMNKPSGRNILVSD